jgi:hypothetical protein
MDPGRPKNQCSQNQTKPMPLRSSRRVDFARILFLANGRRMQKLSHSEVLHKEVKSQLVKG